MTRVFAVLFFCGMLSSALPGQTSLPAGTVNTAQEALVFEHLDTLVRFEDDGTGSRETTAVIKIQSQAGVQAMGQLVFGYSSATESLEISYVRVRMPDARSIETSVSGAQDFAPEVLREAPAYSDYRERHVSVSALQPGDTLEYQTVIHVTTPLASHEFWYEYSFLKAVAFHEEILEIDVPKSRAVKLKSPDRKYETRESGERRIYSWKIKDFVPNRKPNRDEGAMESDFRPDVQISTFAEWQQVGQWYAKLQGDRVVVDASVREKAATLTKGAITPQEKTRRLYDYVAQNIRYVSLSFGVGRLQPHVASEVLQNGYGDCKDKHTLLQSLLKAEGIQSYPVLISSYRELDADVPSPAQFDHEITAVELGKELTWLDTTAEVAPYGLIVYQLRNKQALLAAEGDNAGLRRTPANSPIKNELTIKLDGEFSETGAFDTNVEITAQGDSDLPLRSVFRSIPQVQWQDVLKSLSQMWGLAGEASDIHLDGLEDTSKPFHLAYHYHKDNYFIVPTSGASFRILPPMGLKRLPAINLRKSSEPLNIGPMTEEIYRAHIRFPTNYTIQAPSKVEIARDYGEYSISHELNKNVLDAERRVILKVNELPASRRNDYESFQNVISGEVEQVLSCSITPPSAAALASAAKTTGTPEALEKAATSALERKDFSTAVDLLKRCLEQDANQKDAWDDLGLAYAGINQHEEAVRAFRKQLELDAFHKSANQDLASELQQQGKPEEAIAAYRKQLEITPFAKSTHENLGLLLAEVKKDAEARTELETAASLPPDDPEAKLALAKLYTRTGETAKADALMKSVTGVAASAPGSDVYSSALRDDIDPNQTLREARKTLDDIGDQFDSGDYDRLGPAAFHSMDLVALAWSRIGWAKFLQGENLEALQFLNAAWLLSQSGTVGNRLARVLEKQGQHEKARHLLTLAIAAGGEEVSSSRQQLSKLSGSPDSVDKDVAQAGVELLQMRTVKLSGLTGGSGSAQFALVFDSSDKPGRADWLEGETNFRSNADKLRQTEYPVKFPDESSVKIIRKANLSCAGAACTVVLLPLEGLQTER